MPEKAIAVPLCEGYAWQLFTMPVQCMLPPHGDTPHWAITTGIVQDLDDHWYETKAVAWTGSDR